MRKTEILLSAAWLAAFAGVSTAGAPTLGVVVEQSMLDDPKLTFASLRSFNRWLEDDWGYAYRERIFAPPLLSLLDLDLALAELDRVMKLGARVVHLRAGPVSGQSPADVHFDPFWARLEEAEIPVAFHLADSGYNALFSTHCLAVSSPR